MVYDGLRLTRHRSALLRSFALTISQTSVHAKLAGHWQLFSDGCSLHDLFNVSSHAIMHRSLRQESVAVSLCGCGNIFRLASQQRTYLVLVRIVRNDRWLMILRCQQNIGGHHGYNESTSDHQTTILRTHGDLFRSTRMATRG